MGGGGLGSPMSISGPVASGPTSGGGRTPFEVGQAPTGEHLPPEERGTSFRVYAIVLALLFLCFMAMVTAVVVVVLASSTGGDEAKAPIATAKPAQHQTANAKKGGQDTAEPASKPAPLPPPPPPTQHVKRTSTPSSTPAAAPRAAPSAAPGTIKVSITGGMFLSAQVSCPSGVKERAALSGGSAIVQRIPAGEDCTLNFTGGAPSQYRPVRAGNAYTCTLSGGATTCK